MANNPFPNIQSQGFRATSPATPDYNCIGWAAGEDDRFWWPRPEPDYYWPPGVPREVTLSAFVAAFSTLGYAVCKTPSLEKGYEKIAIYADSAGLPTHAARQLPSGRWTSKLGCNVDIEHTLMGITGPEYGTVKKYMRRRVSATEKRGL